MIYGKNRVSNEIDNIDYDIDVDAKDPYENKYQYLINKRESVG